MATISTSQAHTSLTPPSSSHGQDSWNYSVPAQVEPTSPSADDFPNHNRQLSQPNGYALRPSTETFGPRTAHDSNHLAPVGANELNRQHSDISDTPSAPDSLLDLYENNKGGQGMDFGERRGMNGKKHEMDNLEHSRWIHRDKLARIENEELQAAGITIPRPRTGSKSSRRDRSQDHGNGLRSDGQKRQKMGTNSMGDGDGSNAWDLRLPEEAAGDLGTKGISKIPISKSSPLPIPIDYLERDTPIPRKPSANWYDEDDPLSFKQARSRSHSMKSSFGLDDSAPTTANIPMPTPARISPPPARISPTPARASPSERSPTKKTSGRKGSIGANAALPGSRQASAQRQKQKPGTNAPDLRPKTRSGDIINTSKRPEGDPPWLATMYKPDPRLPPDQQVIPTHAKRMQQEQWEKEGKYGNVYDTSFRPLNQQEHIPRPDSFSPPPDGPEEPESEESAPEWPLAAPQSPTAPISPVSPLSPVFALSSTPTLSTGARSQVERAGSYSTMPKIATGKPQGVNIPDPKPPIRVQDSPESNKGCGCCVIM
ncbi:hypothetical protein SBOR_2693 [Sclerotinia borealis F-4128]|uniref:TeaA receptor TeaR n=1 Tax=Sclerotinia borealis (strain F-4128) TaxID=1432307 RepID=W9CQL8_SCLBF|nr:hypothetical protein SBOR_2693 [Sclerotinia borealis F-4128]